MMSLEEWYILEKSLIVLVEQICKWPLMELLYMNHEQLVQQLSMKQLYTTQITTIQMMEQ